MNAWQWTALLWCVAAVVSMIVVGVLEAMIKAWREARARDEARVVRSHREYGGYSSGEESYGIHEFQLPPRGTADMPPLDDDEWLPRERRPWRGDPWR